MKRPFGWPRKVSEFASGIDEAMLTSQSCGCSCDEARHDAGTENRPAFQKHTGMVNQHHDHFRTHHAYTLLKRVSLYASLFLFWQILLHILTIAQIFVHFFDKIVKYQKHCEAYGFPIGKSPEKLRAIHFHSAHFHSGITRIAGLLPDRIQKGCILVSRDRLPALCHVFTGSPQKIAFPAPDW